jgi:hypothetical protein
MASLAPIIGGWFIDGTQQLFEVVAIDEHANTIEIQYVDGEVSEIDMDSWRLLSVEKGAEPEDWSAPYEMDSEDKESDLILASPMYDPLNLIESELFEGSEEF